MPHHFLGLMATTAAALTACPATAAAPASGLAVVVPATLQAPHGGEFLSPSRNISCELDWGVKGLSPAAYCQTVSPPRSVTMSAVGAVKKCSGMTCIGNPAQNARVLPYMTSVASGPFLCTSRLDGFACSAAGHAFLVSKSGIATYAVLAHTTMALYANPGAHPVLRGGSGFGSIVALDRSGNTAKLLVQCGTATHAKSTSGTIWTVELRSVKSFELETNPANVAAGSVVDISRQNWVDNARTNGWDGYVDLGKSSYLSNGPGNSACG